MSAVFGLGVGPGDPELITVKALRLLRAANVIAYPAPQGGAGFARGIVERWVSPAQQELPIQMPIEAARFPARAIFDQAAREIGAHVEAGRAVAVLCQGDPFFYGSFMYLFGRLAGTHRVEIVPGVSSLGAAAAAGWPLASRNDALTVLPAPLEDEELKRRLGQSEAAAIIKLGRHFARVRNLLTALGLADKARYVERASLGNERVLPLDQVSGDAPYFSMILVHRRGEAWR